MNVLIVDDNGSNRSLLRAMLEPLGHRTILATDGADALAKASGNQIDLIISDILMPVMDGFRFCMAVQKNPELEKIPFVFYTATYTDQDDEAFALSLGADLFIRKPMEPEAFLHQIEGVLQSVGRGEISSDHPGSEEEDAIIQYSYHLAKKLDKKVNDLQKEIASRRKTESKLRGVNRYLESIFNNENVWISVLDAKARVVMWNRAAEKISGYSAEQVKGNGKVWELLYPDPAYRDEMVSQAHAVIHQQEVIEDFESVISCKNGETRTISWYSRNLTNESGKSIGSIFLGRDESRRKQAEREVKELARRYQDLFDANADALYVIDQDGHILDVNVAAERRYQYSREELLKMKTQDLAAEDLQALVPEQVRKMMKIRLPFEWRHRRKDGTEVPVEIAPSVINLSDGQKAILATVRDITERKAAEEEKNHLQKQLNQAQKLESVGRLAGGVAHDYNNILSVILGYTEMAMTNVGADDPLREDLQEIYAAGLRSRDITRQLMAFARKELIEPQSLDLNTCVESILKILRRLIGEDINLTWIPGKGRLSVFMDQSQVDQILTNLCVNARDAITNVGKIVIETRLISFDEAYCSDHIGFKPGSFVMLAISDNGCGMDKKILDNIFDPFFTTKERDQGTGLGLATVYGIASQNNGFINVYSEPELGTTFKIFLPQHLADTTVAEPPEPSGEILSGRGETVLVVEDELSILKLTHRILSNLNYNVLMASTPDEALDIAGDTDSPIDLLLTDVVMPQMNGRDLAERVQALRTNIKVLFMSGYTADIISSKGALSKGDNYIQKPFAIKDIAGKVRAVLEAE